VKAKIELKGKEAFIDSLRSLTSSQQKAMISELHMIAEEIMMEAKRITPVDTGALRATGKITTEQTLHEHRISLGFGDEATDYAIYVHEDLTKYHLPPTQAQFLWQPFNQWLPRIPGRMKSAVNKL